MSKGKPGFLTPKAIANRIKAKGLQKLRWYCQMCQKQCRDENGYKCHIMSESHQRQLLLFAESPGQFVSGFSKEFMTDYLSILKSQFGGKRIHSNVIYQEYIKDRNHIHMNATRWHTLTGFIQWLGRAGICRVDETEKGWFVEYIDRDPVKIHQEKSLAKMDATEDEQMEKFYERQRERMLLTTTTGQQPEYSELRRDEGEKIKISLSFGSKKPELEESAPSTSSTSTTKSKHFNPLVEAEKKARHKLETESAVSTLSSCSSKRKSGCGGANALSEIMSEELAQKAKRSRRDHWIVEGLEVRLMGGSAKLTPGLLYKSAVVQRVINRYTALVQVLGKQDSSGHPMQLEVDQKHLQTTLPAVGGQVRMVNGAYTDTVARLQKVDDHAMTCEVVLDSGVYRGRLVKDVSLNDVCKMRAT